MTEDAPKVNEAYDQLKLFLAKAKEESDLKTQFLLLQQSLENYAKKDKIYEMIKKAIEEQNKNRIQWGPIIQAVITAIIVGAVMRGF